MLSIINLATNDSLNAKINETEKKNLLLLLLLLKVEYLMLVI